MKPIQQTLDAALLSSASPAAASSNQTPAANTSPLTLTGDDKRLQIQIPPGALDLSQAKTSKGTAPGGALTLKITQLHGHFIGAVNMLASYQVELVDAQGQAIQNVLLRKPVTFIYHYQPTELTALNLDPDHLLFTWPDLAASAHSSRARPASAEAQTLSQAVVPLKNDTKAHTLTAQSQVLTAGPFDVGSGSPQNQSPPTPHVASVQGNAGQLSYGYPLQVPPGPLGTIPDLQLLYSSQSTNDRHGPASPAGLLGEGWALSMGSISAETYPDVSAGGAGTYYSISGIDHVSDHLISDVSGSGLFLTEHLSYLRIGQTTSSFGQPCFRVWDGEGNRYELGCTQDSLQYTTDANGQQNYRWDLDRVIPANEGPGTDLKYINISYLQDQVTSNGYTSIRDAAIKQITYGTSGSNGTVAGTVDFSYLAPFTNTPWATAYGASYYNGCSLPDGLSSSLRCDDPADKSGGLPAPRVMSTFTLQNVTSYVGDDSSASHTAYGYSFSYRDTPFSACNDAYTQTPMYCAGEHLLTAVTPVVYQNGSAVTVRGLTFGYSNALQDDYYDTSHTIQGGSQPYHAQTFWQYLTSYHDTSTGIGGTVTYQIAYNNTNGTPNASDGSTRIDPFYCATHSDCTGSYAYPQNQAWSTQVVTSITSTGKDSSDSNLTLSTTSYRYELAVTGSGCPAAGSDTRCVGYTWTPQDMGGYNDGDWQDYFHGSYRGFHVVYITDPSQNLTVDTYSSTAGLFTQMTAVDNYTSGSLRQHDVYWGNQVADAALMVRTVNTYAGDPGTAGSACNSAYTALFVPCIVEALTTKTTFYDGNGTGTANVPWVQQDSTFDDYGASGLVTSGGVYHNLLQERTTSSNAPPVVKKWSYQPTDTWISGTPYYTVHSVVHSEVNDASGHVWQCEDTAYDEGRAAGLPAPLAGWGTTHTTYTDCSNQAATALKSYTAYDSYGNIVASVDPFGAAHSGVYAGNGCTLATTPAFVSANWTAGHYTTCTVYDSSHIQWTSKQNALTQQIGTTYDSSQGAVVSSTTDMNGQSTGYRYSYDGNGNSTIRTLEPGETGSYTVQSVSNSQCSESSALPCYEIDTNPSLYPNDIKRVFYDAQGREVETRTPLDATHDIVQFTVHNDANNTSFASVPFRVPAGSGWIDPATAKDETNQAPAGTITVYDPLHRARAHRDPALGSSAEPGVQCQELGGTWSSCSGYGIGQVASDGATYSYSWDRDANNHLSVTFHDALGRARYTQLYSQPGDLNQNITTKHEMRYNVLDDETAVIVTDMAPQSGQTITQVTTTAAYDDLGRTTSVTDPDRGTRTYSYDADGRQLSEVAGSRTLGTSYDLLGRVRCMQDAAPPDDGSGNCSSGAHALVQNTYGQSFLGTAGSTDFPTGRLTQSIGTTYYQDGSSTSSTEQFQYDQRGRIVTSALQITVPTSWNLTNALPTYKQTQGYNNDNQLMTVQTSVNGQPNLTFSKVYDSTTGELTGLSNNNTGVANLVSRSFDLHGLESDRTFYTTTGTGLAPMATAHITYDGNLRPASMSASWGSGSGGSGTFFSTSRSFDPVGNVSSVSTTQATVQGQSNSGGSETQNFCYNEDSQLVWAGNAGTQPAAGNGTCGSGTLANTLAGAGYTNSFAYTHLDQQWQGPLNGGATQYQYLYCDTAHPHQVSGLYPLGTACSNRTGAVYSTGYDSWGNVTSRNYNNSSAALSYDALDHLLQWNAGSTSQEWYGYDATGARTLRRSNMGSGTSITVYAFGQEEHVYDASGNNTGNTAYYDLGDQADDLVGEMTTTGLRFYLTDELGSVLATFSSTAGSATVLGNQVYGPYGNKRYSKGAMGTDKGFTGQYSDPTGLDYYNARYYDPVVGRFVSADTVQGNLQGMDPYTYVGGNPETHNDPTGHCWPLCTMLAGAITGAVIGAGMSVVSQAVSGHGVNWGEVGKEAAVGAVSGAVSGLAGPGAGLLVHTAVGAASGAAGQITSNLISHKPVGEGVLAAAVVGGVTGVATAGAGKLLQKVGGKISGSASKVAKAACGLSFSSDTPVATPDGEKAIGTLKEGDQVTAYDPASKQTSTQTVQQVFINHDTDLLDVTLSLNAAPTKAEAAPTRSKQQDAEVASHGSHAPPSSHETIHTTQKHPWFTTDKGWVKAGDLHVGEQVQRLDGTTATVTALKVVAGEQDMYDLTVSQVHTFAVGDGQAVVHNCGNGLPGLSKGQKIQGLKEAENFLASQTTNRQRPMAAAITKLAGSNKTLGRAVSGAYKAGRFAPRVDFPYGKAGGGVCAEFNCAENVGKRLGKALDVYVVHRGGKGPCPGCNDTFSQWAAANMAPIRVIWRNARGGISKRIYHP